MCITSVLFLQLQNSYSDSSSSPLNHQKNENEINGITINGNERKWLDSSQQNLPQQNNFHPTTGTISNHQNHRQQQPQPQPQQLQQQRQPHQQLQQPQQQQQHQQQKQNLLFGSDLTQIDKDFIFEGLKNLYQKKVLPLEIASKYSHFSSPPLGPSDFEAKPMVVILGQV